MLSCFVFKKWTTVTLKLISGYPISVPQDNYRIIVAPKKHFPYVDSMVFRDSRAITAIPLAESTKMGILLPSLGLEQLTMWGVR